jgi:hypothetical protein
MGATQINMQLMTERTCRQARMQHAKASACGWPRQTRARSILFAHALVFDVGILVSKNLIALTYVLPHWGRKYIVATR